MKALRLVKAAQEHEFEALSFIAEFVKVGEGNDIHGSAGLDKFLAFNWGYQAWLQEIEQQDGENDLGYKRVPSTVFFLMNEQQSEILGMINIRHQLNEHLMQIGGHIGYGIRPSKRRQGLATAMLGLALSETKKLGIEKALITCYQDNIASARTIQKNGGQLENEFLDKKTNRIIQRYWITLKS